MPRPFKIRCIGHLPGVRAFKPAGVPGRNLVKTTLHFDELEALRLVDGEGMEQAEAAARMQVSRPTVGRILSRARAKVAKALVEGHALLIEEGSAPVCRDQPTAAKKNRSGGRT